jgi:pimeloyl-ACP methyl ester carboxylesterase
MRRTVYSLTVEPDAKADNKNRIRWNMNIKRGFTRLILITAGIIITAILFLAAGVMISNRIVSTPPFRDSTGKILEGSIASLEKIELGGYKQTILIRGKNINNPVLLYLHGGPGSSELPLVRHFNSALESYYTVVLWDQRGAGKSYSLFLDPKTLTIDQMLKDTYELVNILRNRFNKKKIYLAGHSWGSVLGLTTVHMHPDLFYAYIGIGQAIDFMEGERISLRHVIDIAKEQNNTKALKQLEKLTDYPAINDHWMSDMITERKWLGEFGGIMYGKKGIQDLFFISRPPEFTLFDFVPFILGNICSLKILWPQIVHYGDFRKSAPELKLPVYFVTGRHDYNIPFTLTAEYYRNVIAPKKTMVWFERSAHMPNFEEPDKFNDFMINTVLPETYPHNEEVR